MNFVFLGTSASEGYPNAFCACENCEQARQAGGPSLRKRSAALIDGELLIDLGPDLMAASMQHGVSLAKMRYCLQTHEHSDHLDPSHFSSRSPACGVKDAPRLHYYASQNALKRAERILRSDEPKNGFLDPAVSERLNLNVYVVEPFQHFAVGPYQVFSLKANHAHETTAMLYLIEHNGHTIFYGTDTGVIPQETWEALADFGKACDLVVLDHTFGLMLEKRGTTHLNADEFLEQVARLRQIGLITQGTRIFATHFGHHSNPTHPELVAYAAQHGYEVAYDGLVVNL
jgi:phosphoribosyl 1,2-cyclic phosphate phosphodiesterase